MHDSLGNRIKDFYESRYQSWLPRRAYVIVRVDGKAFHSYTRGLQTPFDSGLIEDMDATAISLCKEMQNAVCAYVQSDEISILLADFKKYDTDAWFGNNIQKMVSVSASIATSAFNNLRLNRVPQGGNTHPRFKWANFDSRAFSIPDPTEVENYFIWRQQDATRNSVFAVGRHFFSHNELNNKNNNEVQNMLITLKDVNWNDYPVGCKRGRFVVKQPATAKVRVGDEDIEVERQEWRVVEPPVFTQERAFLGDLLSKLREEMQGAGNDGDKG